MKYRVLIFDGGGAVHVDRGFQFKYEAQRFIGNEVRYGGYDLAYKEILLLKKEVQKYRVVDYSRIHAVVPYNMRLYRINFLINQRKASPKGGATPNFKQFLRPVLRSIPAGLFFNITSIK